MGKLDVPPTQGPSHIRCELERRIGQELRAQTAGERQCRCVKQNRKRHARRKKAAKLHDRASDNRKIDRARAGAQKNSQFARPRLRQPQDPRIEPERTRRKPSKLHDRGSANRKIPGSNPGGRKIGPQFVDDRTRIRSRALASASRVANRRARSAWWFSRWP